MAPREPNVLPEVVQWYNPDHPGHPDDHILTREEQETTKGFTCNGCGKGGYRGRYTYSCVNEDCIVKLHALCAVKQQESIVEQEASNADAAGHHGTSQMLNPSAPLPATRVAASQHNNAAAVKHEASNADDAHGGGRRGASRSFNQCPPLPAVREAGSQRSNAAATGESRNGRGASKLFQRFRPLPPSAGGSKQARQ